MANNENEKGRIGGRAVRDIRYEERPELRQKSGEVFLSGQMTYQDTCQSYNS